MYEGLTSAQRTQRECLATEQQQELYDALAKWKREVWPAYNALGFDMNTALLSSKLEVLIDAFYDEEDEREEWER